MSTALLARARSLCRRGREEDTLLFGTELPRSQRNVISHQARGGHRFPQTVTELRLQMAVLGGLCAVVAAIAMIGWNVLVNERRRRERFYREQRRSEQRKKAMLRLSSARDGGRDDSGGRLLDESNAASPPPSCVEHPFPPTPSTAPCSAERCPVSPASSPPPVFHDLVLILDAPALPPPRRKLPELPEESDTSTDMANQPLSPAGGCDLSPGFHLSVPWSPPPRRGVARTRTRGNRPRTFSEYTAAPTTDPPVRHVRAGSATADLSLVQGAAEADGGGGGWVGGGLGGARARGATYSDGDDFAGFDGWSFENCGVLLPTEGLVRRRNIAGNARRSCSSPIRASRGEDGEVFGRDGSGSGRGGGGGGVRSRRMDGRLDRARPLYPHAREVLPVS